jgi:hypothetical protein
VSEVVTYTTGTIDCPECAGRGRCRRCDGRRQIVVLEGLERLPTTTDEYQRDVMTVTGLAWFEFQQRLERAREQAWKWEHRARAERRILVAALGRADDRRLALGIVWAGVAGCAFVWGVAVAMA